MRRFYRDMKKHIFTAIAALWLILTPWLPVRAAAVFSVKDARAKVGSLMRAEVCVRSDIVLCAGLFEFRFDSSRAEFRSVEPSGDAEVCVKAEEDCVTVAYLNSAETAEESLFSLVFKARQEGDVSLVCSVHDCTDCSAEWMEIQAVNVGNFSVTGSAQAETTAQKQQKSETAPSIKGKSKPEKADGDETVPSVRDKGTKQKNQSDCSDKRPAAIIVLHISAIAVLMTLIFLIRKIKQRKRAESERESVETKEKVE